VLAGILYGRNTAFVASGMVEEGLSPKIQNYTGRNLGYTGETRSLWILKPFRYNDS
jgi:hypothetical protein